MRPETEDRSQLSRRTLMTGTLATAGGLLMNRGEVFGAALQPA